MVKSNFLHEKKNYVSNLVIKNSQISFSRDKLISNLKLHKIV